MKAKFVIYADPEPQAIHSIGIVVRDEHDGGVFRGHCDVWFGKTWAGEPVIKQVLSSLCTPVPDASIPIGD